MAFETKCPVIAERLTFCLAKFLTSFAASNAGSGPSRSSVPQIENRSSSGGYAGEWVSAAISRKRA